MLVGDSETFWATNVTNRHENFLESPHHGTSSRLKRQSKVEYYTWL